MVATKARKARTQFVCKECGAASNKWLGRCMTCEAWNSLVEESSQPAEPEGSMTAIREEFRSLGQNPAGSGTHNNPPHPLWVDLNGGTQGSAAAAGDAVEARLSTSSRELDRVLGGGLVADSFTLLGGDPGIGKSTLLLQMAGGLARAHPGIKIIYASGEESVTQIRGRAKRLAVSAQQTIFLMSEVVLEKVFQAVKELRPQVLVIDSLQTFTTESSPSSPGSVTQVREVAARLMTLAKTACVAVWLVGHVTKEGSIAGPKTIEHMVDTVLYFEGEEGQSYRLLRAVKNRFGSSRELGVFEMQGEGLQEVANPSSLFLSQRSTPVSGTAITATLEGTRPLLIEVQGLVTPSALAMPRRTSVGLDSARVSLLGAILEKHLKVHLSERDLFFNVSGGLKLSDPACDLAAAVAIWSSARDYKMALDWIFLGELGLTGEVRRVSQLELRIQEAARLGFKTVVLPKNNSHEQEESAEWRNIKKIKSLKIISLAQISQLESIFS